MAHIDIEPVGRFATALKSAIEEAGLSLVELAEKCDSSYEHMRKLVAGKAHPSIHLLRILAGVLKADKDEWMTLIEADKFYKIYKHLPKSMGQSRELEKLQSTFPKLTENNQNTIVQMVRTMLRQQRAHQA